MKTRKGVLLAMAVTFVVPGVAAEGRSEMHAMSTKVDSVTTLFHFPAGTSRHSWVSINDDVMGGISSGAATITEDSCLLFSGTLSLENNGGFASIRTAAFDFDLGGYTGIRIRVKGDGRTYQFRLRVDRGFDGAAYKQDFQTAAGAWMEINLPFATFQASYRGRILSDVPPVAASEIKQLGLLIADKTAGQFALRVAEISAYK